jgi:hypothetical protein
MVTARQKREKEKTNAEGTEEPQRSRRVGRQDGEIEERFSLHSE